MHVLLRRSQYEGFWGTIYYTLDAQIDAAPDEADLIAKHSVGEIVVFDSEQRQQYLQRAEEHANAAGQHPVLPTSSDPEQIFLDTLSAIGSTLYSLGGATYNLIAGSLQVRITIADLLSGTHIESEHPNEILDAENIIRGSIAALKTHLANLESIDGQEELYEPE
jgi:hypothetical protein